MSTQKDFKVGDWVEVKYDGLVAHLAVIEEKAPDFLPDAWRLRRPGATKLETVDQQFMELRPAPSAFQQQVLERLRTNPRFLRSVDADMLDITPEED